MSKKRYEEAKKIYSKYGIDTDEALQKLDEFSISIHCWQGDDVLGFDGADSLSGGIQTTGDYIGRARNYEELMDDLDIVLKHVPGQHRLNLHASYAIFDENNKEDRNKLEPKHFKKWVDFARERNLKLDFNPTFFSHSKAIDYTLSSLDENQRKFWVEHCQACIRISEYFSSELDSYSLLNIWIPDGMKDIPANRSIHRKIFKKSLDEVLDIEYDKEKVLVSLESKVFGIGLESYTVGSSEFVQNYSLSKNILPLLDNGHYHPTEYVSDKISTMLMFHDKIALHVTRPVRWDSDHVVLYDDETKEIMKEIISNQAMDRVLVGLDFFDPSINRIAAWILGIRNTQKSMLYALLTPHERLTSLQNEKNYTELLILQEEFKSLPIYDIWDYYLRRNNISSGLEWLIDVKEYEKKELSMRY